MSTRFSVRIERACGVGLLLISLAIPAQADKKKDLYDAATKAGGAGQIEEAARLFCEAAKIDPNYLDSKQMCTLMTSEAERERKRNDDRFTEGLQAFRENRFDDAEQKFRNVRGGSHVDEAKQYLARIPAAKAEKSSAEADNTRFEQAVKSYQQNEFAGARSAFGQVGGSRKNEAQVYLGNISRYEQAMSAADVAANANNPRQALAGYNDAIAIKADGPGDPRGKAARMQTLLASSTTAPGTGGSTRGSTTTTTTTPTRTETVAVVKPSVQQVDTQKLMREAEAAARKGQTGVASGKYLAILAAEPGNAAARTALNALSAQNSSSQQSAGSEADAMLAKAIREFYGGLYDQAEVHIKDYLDAKGSKAGLSQFYLGASKLTRYYLAGASELDRRLLTDAETAFHAAKQVPGFQPPGESFVSPRILATYKATP